MNAGHYATHRASLEPSLVTSARNICPEFADLAGDIDRSLPTVTPRLAVWDSST
jgi:hypothetical protein